MPTPHEFRVETSPTALMHHLASIPVFCFTHLARSQSRSYLVWVGGSLGSVNGPVLASKYALLGATTVTFLICRRSNHAVGCSNGLSEEQ
eukprot:558332-Pleurochrysis_carterae.AAC.1